MSNVRVKICGLTRIEDAQCAIDLGVEFLGLIFAPNSPRKVTIEQARSIIEGVRDAENVRWVGVFQNQGLVELQTLLVQLPVDYVQMHSPTDMAFRAALPVPVFQAQPLDSAQFTTPQAASGALLEPEKGSGVTMHDWLNNARHEDWTRLKQWNEGFPLLMAGGLTADNVPKGLDLLRRKQAAPFALDVASGVEDSPGVKDWDKIKTFCKHVHVVPSDFMGLFAGDLDE